MSNPYDQFDSLPATAAEPNPYDQFDAFPTRPPGLPLRTDSFGGILIDEPVPSPRPPVTDSFGGVLVEDWPGSSAPYRHALRAPSVNAPAPGTQPASGRFTPEQYEAFARLSGLGPAMAAGTLPLEAVRSWPFATPEERTPQAPQDASAIPRILDSRAVEIGPERPVAFTIEPPGAKPADGELEPAEDGVTAPVPHAPVSTTPRERQTPRDDAERARQEKFLRDSQQALATLDTRRQQRGGYEDRDAADMRKAITRNISNARAALGEFSPDQLSARQAAWENWVNSLARGASSEGPMKGAEGIYTSALATIGKNEFQDTPTADLRKRIEDGEYRAKWMREEYELDNAHLAIPAPRTQIERLELTNKFMRDELNYREAKGESVDHMLRQWLEMTAADSTRLRKQVREALHVDDEFANSLPGQVLQGLGQLSTAPAYVVPGLGTAVTYGQLYQEARDDYEESMRRQGKPVDDDEAHRVALKYVAAAMPLEVFTDKLILAKALKPLQGKVTVKQLAKTFSILALAGGGTESIQQLQLNFLAKVLDRYDSERLLDKEVWDSLFVGGVVAGTGGAIGHVMAPAAKPKEKRNVAEKKPGSAAGAPSRAVDQETKLNKSMAEWKRQGVQASIREEAAASRAGALREKLDLAEAGTPLNEALFPEIADFGRLVFRQGMDYLDWSMRMVRDLGAKITAHLPRLWRAVQEAAGNAVSRLRAGAFRSYIIREGRLMSIDEGASDPFESESSTPAKHLPDEVAAHWKSLYRPGMSYLDWARRAMAGQPAIHAYSLATIWNEQTGHDHVAPATSLSEAKTRIDALIPEWQDLKEFEAFLKTRQPDPSGWQLPAVRARLNAIAHEVSQILTVPATEKPKVTIKTRSLPDYMKTNIERGQIIFEKLVSAKLGPFDLTVIKNEEKNSFERFDNRLSIMYLRPDVLPHVVAHEIAHDIEARHPEINKATRAFLMKRKEEGDTVKLSTLTNNPEHTDDVHLDKWAERGGDPYTGRDYSSGHTEILSTGIQRLVEDPAGFRVRDPEHFELVVKILRGW